jgi:hypothetical protein
MSDILQGHRTYPAFVHFLCSVTLLSIYIAIMSISALWYAFHNPFTIVSPEYHLYRLASLMLGLQNEATPIHELILAFAGIIFTLVIGSFFSYHIYLISYVNPLSFDLLITHPRGLVEPIRRRLKISRPSYSCDTYLPSPARDTHSLILH